MSWYDINQCRQSCVACRRELDDMGCDCKVPPYGILSQIEEYQSMIEENKRLKATLKQCREMWEADKSKIRSLQIALDNAMASELDDSV